MTDEKPPPYTTLDLAYPGAPEQPPPQYPAQGYPTQPGYTPQQPVYPPQQPGYPPQQAGYTPQQHGYQTQHPYPQGQIPPPGSTVVVTAQPTTTIVTTTMIHYTDRPLTTNCPNCHNHVTSVVNKTVGGLVWLIAAIIFILGLWPFCLIPFCLTDLYDCEHTCPVCRHHLGSYRRL